MPFTTTSKRSVYLMVQRQRRHPFLALFDGADPNASTPRRETTTVPTQALYFLNDPFFHAQAGRFAAPLIDADPADDAALAATPIAAPAARTRSAAEQDVAVKLPDGVSRLAATRHGRPTPASCWPATSSCTSIDAHRGVDPCQPTHLLRPPTASLPRRLVRRRQLAAVARHRRSNCWPTRGIRWRRDSAAFSRQGEARDLPVHERRRVARRYVRSQARAVRRPRQGGEARPSRDQESARL